MENTPWYGAHCHLCAVTYIHPGEIIFVDIDIDPDAAQIGDQVELILWCDVLPLACSNVHDAAGKGGVDMQLFFDLAALLQLLDLMGGYIKQLQPLTGAAQQASGRFFHPPRCAVAHCLPVFQCHQILSLGSYQIGRVERQQNGVFIDPYACLIHP